MDLIAAEIYTYTSSYSHIHKSKSTAMFNKCCNPLFWFKKKIKMNVVLKHMYQYDQKKYCKLHHHLESCKSIGQTWINFLYFNHSIFTQKILSFSFVAVKLSLEGIWSGHRKSWVHCYSCERTAIQVLLSVNLNFQKLH